MNKSLKIVIWSTGTVLFLAIAVWSYLGLFDRQEEIEHTGGSIDSGIALFQDKKYSEAMDVFEGISPDGQEYWRVLYYQGSTHIMLKNYQSAVVSLEQALGLNPTQTQIMHSLGVAYFKLGNLKMSKAYFASILELEPDNTEAKGLMDIMANLERQQPGVSQDESTPEANDGDESH